MSVPDIRLDLKNLLRNLSVGKTITVCVGDNTYLHGIIQSIGADYIRVSACQSEVVFVPFSSIRYIKVTVDATKQA